MNYAKQNVTVGDIIFGDCNCNVSVYSGIWNDGGTRIWNGYGGDSIPEHIAAAPVTYITIDTKYSELVIECDLNARNKLN